MELTLLTKGKTCGKYQTLSVLIKYGSQSAVTDLAILTGGYFSDITVSDDKGLKGRIGRNHVRTDDTFSNDNDVEKIDHGFLYDDCSAIRPVLLSSSLFSQITSNRVKGYNGTEEVSYGEYPQYAPDINTQRKLERNYQNKKLELTGKKYTFNDIQKANAFQGDSFVTYDEYKFNGNKYIRVYATTYSSEYGSKVKLSNGKKYKSGDYVWIKVEPVVWLIDDDTKMLISKRSILSGIRFYYEKSNKFDSTTMYHYLNNIMINDLFQTADLKKEKANDEEVEQKEKSKVELLLNEINSYIELLPNNKLFKDKINKLINDYNEKLDRIKNEKNDVFSFETLDSITNNLEMSLNMILFDLTNSSNYFDILDYINVCLSSFDEDKQEEKENETEEKDELINDLDILSNYCISFLKEEDGNKIKEEVISIFNSEKENIERYLNNKFTNLDENDVKLNYSSKENFIIEIRKRLHPILENLVDKVSKRDIELEITSATKSIIDNTFDATKKGYLANNFKEINTITNEINSYISQVEDVNKSQEFMSKLSKVLSTEIDYTKDTKDIYKQILDIIISLHRLNLEVTEYIKEMEKINNSYIKPIK